MWIMSNHIEATLPCSLEVGYGPFVMHAIQKKRHPKYLGRVGGPKMFNDGERIAGVANRTKKIPNVKNSG